MVRHRFGCRVMCRILEHTGGEFQMQLNTKTMVNEVLKDAFELLSHNFGHHVIESIFEHGMSEHKHQIALALHSNLAAYVCDRHGSYVIEKALERCSAEDQKMLTNSLLSNADNLAWIAEDQSGFHVVKALLAHTEETRHATLAMLQPSFERLYMSQNGVRVIQAVQGYASQAH